MKISNWNIERPKKGTKKTKLVLQKILEIDSDIIVLTETSTAINLKNQYPYSISTQSFERTPDEQWVTIWSKYPIVEQIETFESKRTVCANIKTRNENIIIYGTIIPYHMAGVSGVRYGNLGYKMWEYHEKDLNIQSRDWKKIISQNSNSTFFIIGDFNQSRNGNIGYGTSKVRNQLTQILEELELICLTEIDFSNTHLTIDPKKGKIRNNIDHICVSKNFVESRNKIKIGAWNHFNEKNEYYSDHNGVYIEYE